MLRQALRRLFSTGNRMKIPKPGRFAIDARKFKEEINGFLLYENPSTTQFKRLSILLMGTVAYFIAMMYLIPDP